MAEMRQIINVMTGEITEVELTAEEIAEKETIQSRIDAQIAENQAKMAIRQNALDKLIDLGLTEEEVKAFLG